MLWNIFYDAFWRLLNGWFIRETLHQNKIFLTEKKNLLSLTVEYSEISHLEMMIIFQKTLVTLDLRLRYNSRVISQMLNATIFTFKDIIHVNTRSNFVIPPTLHRHCCFPTSLFNYVLHTAIYSARWKCTLKAPSLREDLLLLLLYK